MAHIKVAELKSVKDSKSPIKADDVVTIGSDIVKIFPTGVNLKNMADATMKVLTKVTTLYHLNGEQKKDLVVDILCYVVDNTDAGALEFLDPVIKDMLPGLIDTLIKVDGGKLHIAPQPKKCGNKLKSCLGCK
jgi:hypothetical protein|tara:strand:- start:2178 stop:2576 length:399 start_codon:yes stop_codon:yes gene_type:complete